MGCHQSKGKYHKSPQQTSPNYDIYYKTQYMNSENLRTAAYEENTRCQTTFSQSKNLREKPSLAKIYENNPHFTISDDGLKTSNLDLKDPKKKKSHSEDLTWEFFDIKQQMREKVYTENNNIGNKNINNSNIAEVKIIFNTLPEMKRQQSQNSQQSNKNNTSIDNSRKQQTLQRVRKQVKSLESMNLEVRNDKINKKQQVKMNNFKLLDSDLSSIKRRRKQANQNLQQQLE